MKKIFGIVVILLLATASFSQSTEKSGTLKDKIFYMSLVDGMDRIVDYQFDVTDTAKIMNTEVYKHWASDTANTGKKLANFLFTKIFMANFEIKWMMKNQSSYSPVPNTKGLISVTAKDEILISFYCQGTNGYGNTITSEAYYALSWDSVNNKQKVFKFID